MPDRTEREQESQRERRIRTLLDLASWSRSIGQPTEGDKFESYALALAELKDNAE